MRSSDKWRFWQKVSWLAPDQLPTRALFFMGSYGFIPKSISSRKCKEIFIFFLFYRSTREVPWFRMGTLWEWFLMIRANWESLFFLSILIILHPKLINGKEICNNLQMCKLKSKIIWMEIIIKLILIFPIIFINPSDPYIKRGNL